MQLNNSIPETANQRKIVVVPTTIEERSFVIIQTLLIEQKPGACDLKSKK